MPGAEHANNALTKDNMGSERIVGLLRGMIESLIAHVKRHSMAEDPSRRTLDDLAKRLRESNTPEELRDISTELAVACVQLGDVTETVIEDTLRKRHEDIKQTLVTVTQGIRSLASGNTDLNDTVSQEMSNIEQLVDEVTVAGGGERLVTITNSLLDVTRRVKEEIVRTNQRVGEATSRVKHLEEQLERTREESRRDGLTRLANRRAFNEILAQTCRGEGIKMPCCLVMVDIDKFKVVNDTHGHLIGDALLMKVARIIDHATDKGSCAARYGGEEFCLILGETPLTKARELSDSLRKQVKAARWAYRKDNKQCSLSATISLGIALFRQGDNSDSFIERADKAMYFAKNSGRDRVCTELDIM